MEPWSCVSLVIVAILGISNAATLTNEFAGLDFDATDPPTHHTEIEAGVYFEDFFGLNSQSHTFDSEFWLVYRWHDGRNYSKLFRKDGVLTGLAETERTDCSVRRLGAGHGSTPAAGGGSRHFLELGHKDLDSLWRPDLHIRNLRGDLKVYSELIRLYDDGTAEMFQLVFAKLELHDVWYAPYPFDHQMLSVKIESLAHTTEQITIVVLPEFSGVNLELAEQWPGWVPSGDHAIHFSVEDISPHYAHIASNSHRCELRSRYHIDVAIERALGKTVTNHFFPLITLVMVTWISSWISIKALMPRVAVGFISFLTLSNMASSISKHLPDVSYDTWISLFIMNQRLFVILTLVETAMCTAIADKLSTRVSVKLDTLARRLFPLDFLCITVFLFAIGMTGVTERDQYMSKLQAAAVIVYVNGILVLLALGFCIVHAYRNLVRDMRLDPIKVHLDSVRTRPLDKNEITLLFRAFDEKNAGVVGVEEIVHAICKSRHSLHLSEKPRSLMKLLRREKDMAEAVNLEHFVKIYPVLLARVGLIAQMAELPEVDSMASLREDALEKDKEATEEDVKEGGSGAAVAI